MATGRNDHACSPVATTVPAVAGFFTEKKRSGSYAGPVRSHRKIPAGNPFPPFPGDGNAPGEDLSRESVTEDPDLISEELAEIYAKQGFYSKASEIYTRLSLLYPEKSVYFAEILTGLGDSESD